MKYTVKKLRKIATERGLTYNYSYSKEELCKYLDIPYEPGLSTEHSDRLKSAVSKCLTNTTTGDRIILPSIYRTSKVLNINPRYVMMYVKTGSPVEYNDGMYTLTRMDV